MNEDVAAFLGIEVDDELWPTLSPDGEQVAFSWNGEKPDKGAKARGFADFDIYLKLVGSSDIRRLTMEPGRNWSGGWSPDGRQVAIRHEGPEGSAIYLISPVSGARRKLISFPVLGPPLLAWSPDGKWIVAAGHAKAPDGSGIYVIPVDGGAARRVTQPKAQQSLISPALSPDGHRLAYLVCEITSGGTSCELEVTELDERWQPASAPRRLASPVKPDESVPGRPVGMLGMPGTAGPPWMRRMESVTRRSISG